MAYFTYLGNDDNEAIGATITASTADADYPIANLTALPISKPFRFTGDAAENILFDLLTAKSINLATVINHNLTAAATITLTAGTTSACGDYSVAIPYRQYDAFKFLGTTRTYRYWKMTFADAANPDTYIQVGYAMLGLATTLSVNYSYRWRELLEHVNYQFISEMGVEHMARLFKRRRFSFSWNGLSDAQMAEIVSMFSSLECNMTPVFILPDPDLTDGYFGRWTSDPEISVDYYRSGSVEFRESSRGRSVGA